MVRRSNPSLAGEFLILVAVSNQITKRTAPAIRKSECLFKKAGNGFSKETRRLARLDITPIGHSEHQNLAHISEPPIRIGHPSAQLMRDRGVI